MLRKVYTSVFHCDKCNKDISLDILSQDVNFEIRQQDKDFARAANMQYHADAEHTVCAICGEKVSGEDFDLIIGKTYTGRINQTYLRENSGFNKDRDLLTIHKHCTGPIISK